MTAHNPVSQSQVKHRDPMDPDQNHPPCLVDDAGFVDGGHWITMALVFKDWTKRHREPHAVITAERMAATVDDIVPDLMMVASGIVEAEWDRLTEEELATSPFWKTFDSMCAQFASGYQPRDATRFVKDLVMRLADQR
jgi:hypothetical protein